MERTDRECEICCGSPPRPPADSLQSGGTVATAKGAKQKVTCYVRDQNVPTGFVMFMDGWGEPARRFVDAGVRGKNLKITKFKVQHIGAKELPYIHYGSKYKLVIIDATSIAVQPDNDEIPDRFPRLLLKDLLLLTTSCVCSVDGILVYAKPKEEREVPQKPPNAGKMKRLVCNAEIATGAATVSVGMWEEVGGAAGLATELENKKERRTWELQYSTSSPPPCFMNRKIASRTKPVTRTQVPKQRNMSNNDILQ